MKRKEGWQEGRKKERKKKKISRHKYNSVKVQFKVHIKTENINFKNIDTTWE